ncbi:MAG TPA: 4-hydroxythreonine-4-phosphate dehydrogenase PdxA [Orrella sp.]
MAEQSRLAITMGDPAGIGPEIVAKLFTHGTANCIVYGDAQCFERATERLNLELPLTVLTSPSDPLPSLGVPLIQACDPVTPELKLGQISSEAGKAAYQCVERAITDALAGLVGGVVTAPLSKKAIELAGFDFPGHTEILAHRCGNVPVAMMLANDEIRTVLVTIHIPLSAVAQTITQPLETQAIELAHRGCVELGIAEPRIAVAGLNPHASESGKFGDEEERIIKPAIEAAKASGFNVSGPWPGDTIFGRARQGEFDVVVAQYHDQGLIPVKYLGLDQGVNITIGLPFVRTSVDHGTAFDIAELGVASPASLEQAVSIARTLIAHR